MKSTGNAVVIATGSDSSPTMLSLGNRFQPSYNHAHLQSALALLPGLGPVKSHTLLQSIHEKGYRISM